MDQSVAAVARRQTSTRSTKGTPHEHQRSENDRLKANVPAIDKFDSKLVTDRLEAHCAIAASAITSGLTNVVNIDASGVGYYTWKELGVMTDGHSIGHMHPDQPKRDKLCIPIRKFHAQRVADLAKRLDSVKEGNGTVLDNTLIVWMSDSGEEHHGFCREWPLVLLGNLGGRLKTAGRFLQFPTYKDDGNQIPGHRTIANFYLALLHAVGDKRDFLRIGSLCGLTMPGLLAAQTQAATDKNAYKNKSVVFLFLQGGPPQIETFDPKLDVPDNNRSCTGEIQTKVPGIWFGGTFPKLAQWADRLAVVRSFASGDGSHNPIPILTGKHPSKATMGAMCARATGPFHARTGVPMNTVIIPFDGD